MARNGDLHLTTVANVDKTYVTIHTNIQTNTNFKLSFILNCAYSKDCWNRVYLGMFDRVRIKITRYHCEILRQQNYLNKVI